MPIPQKNWFSWRKVRASASLVFVAAAKRGLVALVHDTSSRPLVDAVLRALVTLAVRPGRAPDVGAGPQGLHDDGRRPWIERRPPRRPRERGEGGLPALPEFRRLVAQATGRAVSEIVLPVEDRE